MLIWNGRVYYSEMLRGKSSMALRGYSKFLTSPAAWAAYSAVVATPIFARFIVPLVSRVPFLNRYRLVVLLVSAVILFAVARMFGGILQSILLGAAAGFTINAFQASAFGQSVIGRLNGIASQAGGQ